MLSSHCKAGVCACVLLTDTWLGLLQNCNPNHADPEQRCKCQTTGAVDGHSEHTPRSLTAWPPSPEGGNFPFVNPGIMAAVDHLRPFVNHYAPLLKLPADNTMSYLLNLKNTNVKFQVSEVRGRARFVLFVSADVSHVGASRPCRHRRALHRRVKAGLGL